MTTVATINRGTSRNPFIMGCLRILFWLSAHYNFHITAHFIKGLSNTVADNISRIHEPKQFHHLLPFICPTPLELHPWIWTDPVLYLLDSGERLHDYLRAFYHVFMGEPTLYIIDDCSASTALTKKKDIFSMLAFSGHHAQQSVWVLTQKYNSVLKDLREQTRWVCLFHCKDRDSFEDCLRENDEIPSREQRALVRQQLA